MVAPLPITPFERYVVYESGDRYGSGSLEAFPPRLRLHAVSFSAGPVSPLHAAAARAPEGRVFLSWARFPWFAEVCEEGRPAVRLRDARYPGPTGEWASTVVRPVGALSPVDPPATCSDSTPGALRSAPG